MAHEITENDAMISGRNITPWHKLGEITDNFGIEDLHRIMGWEVKKLQTYVEFQNYQSMQTNSFATVRMPRTSDEHPIILGAGLSDKYSILQNSELIKIIEPFVEQGCILETAGTIKQGRKIWIMLRLSGQICVSNEDIIDKYILVSNDHTGAQAARFGLTGVRVVCNNTLTLAESAKTSQIIRVMHTGDVNKNMQTVSQMLNHVDGKFDNYSHDLKKLSREGISGRDLREYVRDCFLPTFSTKDEDKKEERMLKVEKKVIELFEVGPGADMKSARGTVYGAYQAVNHYLNHNLDIDLEKRLESIAWGARARMDKIAFTQAMKLAA